MNVLCFSGGQDSTLLLAILIEQGIEFDIVQLRHHWSKKQSKPVDELIKKHNLKVFSYPPAAMNLIGKDNEISLVFEYAGLIPLIVDVVEGDRCLIDLPPERLLYSPFKYETVYLGTRKDDSHSVLGQPISAQDVVINGVRYLSPLWDYTRADVQRELALRGFDADEVDDDVNTGNVEVCSNCLQQGEGQVWCKADKQMMDRVPWDGAKNLAEMRRVYGVATNHNNDGSRVCGTKPSPRTEPVSGCHRSS